MAERGPPALKLPTVCKPTKTKATDQARANDPPLVPDVVVVPPDQVPDPAGKYKKKKSSVKSRKSNHKQHGNESSQVPSQHKK